MERPSAAEGDQDVLPGIEPAIDREHANGVDHVLVGDIDDRPGRLKPAKTNATAELVELRLRFRQAERDRAAEEVLRVQPPQNQIGIGDGDLLTTAVIADRTGIGPGAPRTYTQQTAHVDPGDRAASSADGCEIDRRRGDGEAPLDLEVGRVRNFAVAHQTDVAGGTPHVEGNEIPLSGACKCKLPEVLASDDAASQPGEEELH